MTKINYIIPPVVILIDYCSVVRTELDRMVRLIQPSTTLHIGPTIINSAVSLTIVLSNPILLNCDSKPSSACIPV